jgi:hypothetical protein
MCFPQLGPSIFKLRSYFEYEFRWFYFVGINVYFCKNLMAHANTPDGQSAEFLNVKPEVNTRTNYWALER